MDKRFFVLLIFATIQLSVFSKTGNIQGTLIEEQAGQKVPLPFANVFLEGTTTGTTTDFNGNFLFNALPGNYYLLCTFMGYETFRKAIEVTVEGSITLNIEMKPEGIAIEGVQVIAKMNRESEMALIIEQKNATIALEAIGAKELSAKGVSDAAGAVTKVTGITKQEDSGTLNVRGLGDRYNTTTLNRLPLPSNNPEVKNIDLALFTTEVISHISIEKNYSASLYGDFGGANIDIVSKRLTGDSFLTISLKGSSNSTLIGTDEFYLTDGPNKTGFYNQDLPDIDAIRSKEAYGFENSWDPFESKLLPNIGLGLSGGKSFDVKGGKLNSFFTLSFDNEKQYTERVERIISATGVPLTDMKGEEFIYETQSSGMVNLNYSKDKSEFYLNSMLLNSSEQSLISLQGNIRDVGENAFRRRGEFNRNMIVVNQLLGEHKLNNGFSMDWGLAYNYVWNTVPDRQQTQYTTYKEVNNSGEFDTEPAGANFRYFHEFDDKEWAFNYAVHKIFNEDNNGKYKHRLSVGYSGKFKNREFINYQFNHDIDEGVIVNVNEVDFYINEENYVNSEYKVVIVEPRDETGTAKDGEEYKGKVQTNSLFGLWEWNINSRWLLLAGLRAEKVDQKITTRANQITGIGTNVKSFEFNELKLLPSLAVKFALNDKQNIRFASSKTYTLPQLQEMPFMSFSGISDEIYGNPYLKPSEVYNADLKWEFFPKGGLLSLATFVKYIKNPINKTTLAGTQNSYFVANTGDWAYVYGFELDAKKDLYKVGSKKLFAAGNLSIMNSKMELDSDKIREETDYNFNAKFNDTLSALQGAAPVLANLSLGYSQSWAEVNSISAILVYNYTSDRLYAIGQSERGSEYDKATNTLDFIVKSTFGKVGIDLSAKNLLNAKYERIQKNRVEENGNHVIRQYKRGISYSISIKYNF